MTVDGKAVSRKVNITSKETNYGSLQVLLDEINRDLPRVAKHNFNIYHQYNSQKHLREDLSPDEVMVHIDFSENYNCKYGSEIQSMHFGSYKKQNSFHTGVAYTRERTLSFCSVSDCLQHGPSGIWAHLHPVLVYLRQETDTTVIHFISDGPTTQYRNKLIFYLLANKIFDFGFSSATWSFLEAGHGKGAADVIGAVIKRSADRFVYEGGDVIGTDDLISALESKGTSVKLVKIKEDQVKYIEDGLPTTIKPITKTMQIHQVFTNIFFCNVVHNEILDCIKLNHTVLNVNLALDLQIIVPRRGTIMHRPLSCFSARPASCLCFKPDTYSFTTQVGFLYYKFLGLIC